jgi:hypothetical protein
MSLTESEKKKYKKDLNILAYILLKFNQNTIVNNYKMKEKFFDAVYSNSIKESEKQYAENLKASYLNTAMKIEKTTFEIEKIKGIALKIASDYEKIGISFADLVEIKKEKEKEKNMKLYGQAVKDVLLQRSRLNKIIENNNLIFLNSEMGRILRFRI